MGLNKDKFYLIIILVLAGGIGYLIWKMERLQELANNNNEELKRSIIASDTLLMESEGRYAKLVNYYNSSQDLNNQLKKSNSDLYKSIKSQDEKILSLTSSIVSLRGKIDEGFGSINETDSTKIDLKLTYPDQIDPFITWNGSVNRLTAKYNGEWKFGQLPIDIIITEESRGLWKHRIVGPEWFKVDSLSVNSLPPDEYVQSKERNIHLMIGANYSHSLSPIGTNAVGVGAGINILNQHMILFGANSSQQVTLGYYYKLRSLKRK
jgi:hypothetical protein